VVPLEQSPHLRNDRHMIDLAGGLRYARGGVTN